MPPERSRYNLGPIEGERIAPFLRSDLETADTIFSKEPETQVTAQPAAIDI